MKRVLILTSLLTLCGNPSFAHAFLDKATPQVGSTVTAPPDRVTIDLTEELEGKYSSIEVDDAQGNRVDQNDSKLAVDNPKQMQVDLYPLPPGAYKVVWKATSTDTHKTHGTFTFTVSG